MSTNSSDSNKRLEEILTSLKEDYNISKTPENDKIVSNIKKYNTVDLLDSILNKSNTNTDSIPTDSKIALTPNSNAEKFSKIIDNIDNMSGVNPKNQTHDKTKTEDSVDSISKKSDKGSVTSSQVSDENKKKLENVDNSLNSDSDVDVKKYTPKNEITNDNDNDNNNEPYSPEQKSYINLTKRREIYMKNFKVNFEKFSSSSSYSDQKIPIKSNTSVSANDNIKKAIEQLVDSKQEELSTTLGEIGEFSNVIQTKSIFKDLEIMKKTNRKKSVVSLVLFTISLFITIVDSSNFLGFQKYITPYISTGLNLCIVTITAMLCVPYIKDFFSGIFAHKLKKQATLVMTMICMLGFNLFVFTDVDSISKYNLQLYTPVLLLCVLFAFLGDRFKLNTIIKNFENLNDCNGAISIGHMANLNLQKNLLNKSDKDDKPIISTIKTPFISNFIKTSFDRDIIDKNSNTFTGITLIIGVVLGIVSLIFGQEIHVALNIVCAVFLVGCSPLSSLITNLTLSRANKELNNDNCVISSCKAAKSINDSNKILFESSDLFTVDDVKLYGIETFSNSSIDKAILDATSVLCETRSVLCGLFTKIIANNFEYLDKVEDIKYENAMGLSAWVMKKKLLIGSEQLMKNHNIEVPEFKKPKVLGESAYIYLASEGKLSAVFIIGIQANEQTSNLLVDLYNEECSFIVKSVDSILTSEFLSKVFKLPQKSFKVVSSIYHKEIEQSSESSEPIDSGVFLFKEGKNPLLDYLQSVLSCKYIYQSVRLGFFIHTMILVIGFIISIILVAFNGFSHITNNVLILYHSISILVYFMIASFKRLI